MNRSKKILWDEIKTLYESGVYPKEIMEDIKSREYFDPSIIPNIATLYRMLSDGGLIKRRKQDDTDKKALEDQLRALRQKLQETKYQKQVNLLVNSLRTEESSIDDITLEKIAEIKVLMAEVVNSARKKEDGKINVDKLGKAVKLLDTFTNTLIKARVLEGKATEKVDIEEKKTLLDKMRDNYIDETIGIIEESMTESEPSIKGDEG